MTLTTIIYRVGVTALLLIFVSACDVFNQEDTEATLAAENAAYATEIAAIPTQVAADATEISATLYVAQTQSIADRSVVQQLQATVSVGQTATPALEVAVAPEVRIDRANSSAADSMPGESGASTGASGVEFTQVTISSSVRESDGCANNTQTTFSTTSNRIYLTGVAWNLQAGQVISSNWYYGDSGTVEASVQWQAPENYQSLCIWFFISPTETDNLDLRAGQWSAQFFVNGQSTGPRVSFTVTES